MADLELNIPKLHIPTDDEILPYTQKEGIIEMAEALMETPVKSPRRELISYETSFNALWPVMVGVIFTTTFAAIGFRISFENSVLGFNYLPPALGVAGLALGTGIGSAVSLIIQNSNSDRS